MKRLSSLRSLQLAHGLAFLVLVVITGVVGGTTIFLRHEAAQEALRLNQLLQSAQLTRGELYRQMKEVFDHNFLADPQARDQYDEYSRLIDAEFARLQSLVGSEIERDAVADLHTAYEKVRRETDVLMTRPIGSLSTAERLQAFDTNLEGVRLSGYEEAFAATEALFLLAQQSVHDRIDRLTRMALLILLVPIGLAAALLLLARAYLRRAFVEPLRELLQATEKYRAGDLDHKVPEAGAAELATLAESINTMAGELSESRAALIRSERQATLGALVPVIAHNIRNPLASIRATAQVTDDPALGADLREGLRGIVGTVDRLETWLGALLSYLNPQMQRMVRTSLAIIADDALSMLAPRLEGKEISVIREGWQTDATVTLDRHLMEQAIYGLLANAVEAMPAGSSLRIAISTTASEALLTIDDEGPGMPFTPAPSGLAPGPTTKTYGSGLGIPFAYKICDLHGGRLDFAAAPGGGTRAAVAVPLAEQVSTAA